MRCWKMSPQASVAAEQLGSKKIHHFNLGDFFHISPTTKELLKLSPQIRVQFSCPFGESTSPTLHHGRDSIICPHPYQKPIPCHIHTHTTPYHLLTSSNHLPTSFPPKGSLLKLVQKQRVEAPTNCHEISRVSTPIQDLQTGLKNPRAIHWKLLHESGQLQNTPKLGISEIRGTDVHLSC